LVQCSLSLCHSVSACWGVTALLCVLDVTLSLHAAGVSACWGWCDGFSLLSTHCLTVSACWGWCGVTSEYPTIAVDRSSRHIISSYHRPLYHHHITRCGARRCADPMRSMSSRNAVDRSARHQYPTIISAVKISFHHITSRCIIIIIIISRVTDSCADALNVVVMEWCVGVVDGAGGMLSGLV